MKFTKKLCFLIALVFFEISNIFNISVIADSPALCPAEYAEYVKVDKLTNIMFADIPSALISNIKDWKKTEWGRKTFKKDSERNTIIPLFEKLSQEVYYFIENRYNIPKELTPYFIIVKNLGRTPGTKYGYNCFFDSFIPEFLKSKAETELPRIRSLFYPEAKETVDWMQKCAKERKFIEFEKIHEEASSSSDSSKISTTEAKLE